MPKLLLEPETEARWSGFDEVVEVCDHTGRLLGYFRPAKPEGTSLKHLSGFSDDELRQRCQQTGGRALSEILRDLKTQ